MCVHNIKLWSPFLDTAVFNDEKLLKVFIWCLLKAGTKEVIKESLILKRGQLATGRVSASEELFMSPSMFRRKLLLLNELDVVNTSVQGAFTVVTICNYDSYVSDNFKDSERLNTYNIVYEQDNGKVNLVNRDISKQDNGKVQKLLTSIPNEYIRYTRVFKRTPRKKKVFKETLPLISYFCKKYKERFGKPYIVAYGKDGASIKQLLSGGLTFVTLTQAMDKFINDHDPWLEKVGYTISVFKARVNKYAVENATPDHLELEFRD